MMIIKHSSFQQDVLKIKRFENIFYKNMSVDYIKNLEENIPLIELDIECMNTTQKKLKHFTKELKRDGKWHWAKLRIQLFKNNNNQKFPLIIKTNKSDNILISLKVAKNNQNFIKKYNYGNIRDFHVKYIFDMLKCNFFASIIVDDSDFDSLQTKNWHEYKLLCIGLSDNNLK